MRSGRPSGHLGEARWKITAPGGGIGCAGFPACGPSGGTVVVCIRQYIGLGDTAGMQALDDGPGYERTGGGDNATRHPDHHYGTPTMVQALKAVAYSFRVYYPAKILGYNDISLRWGGVFDIETAAYPRPPDWTPPHCGHRTETSCDVRTKNLNKLERRKLQVLLRKNGFKAPYIEGDHWHCTVR